MCTADVQLRQYSFVDELCMINCSIHLLCHCDKTCMLLHERQQHACVCSYSMYWVHACVCMLHERQLMVQLSGFGSGQNFWQQNSKPKKFWMSGFWLKPAAVRFLAEAKIFWHLNAA